MNANARFLKTINANATIARERKKAKASNYVFLLRELLVNERNIINKIWSPHFFLFKYVANFIILHSKNIIKLRIF